MASPSAAPTTLAPTAGDEKNPWSVPSGTWSEVKSTVEVNLFLGLCLLACFAYFKDRAGVFCPRRTYRPSRVPAGLRDGIMGLLDVARMDDGRLRRGVGYDAHTLLRFLRAMRRLCLAGSVVAVGVLAPVYGSGLNEKSGFYKYTMGNLAKKGERLWAPVAFAYVFTGLACRAMELEARAYAEARTAFLASGDDDGSPQPRCSVLVERVPVDLRSGDALARYFERLMGPGSVHSAVVYADCRKLERARLARDAAAARAGDGGRVAAPRWDGDAAATGEARCCWRVAPAGAYWAARRGRLDRELRAGRAAHRARVADAGGAYAPLPSEPEAKDARDALGEAAGAAAARTRDLAASATRGLLSTLALEDVALSRPLDLSSTAVVTFASPGVAATVSQIALADFRGVVAAEGLAPARDDLVFENVANDPAGVEYRCWCADGFLLWVGAMWTPLISLILAFNNLGALAEALPWLRPFVEEPRYAYARSLVTGYLPVVLALGVLVLVPVGLEWLATHYVRLKAKSAIQSYVLSRHFGFQLLTIFVTVLSGSLLHVLKKFLKHPGSFVDFLGESLPQVGAYFLQLLVTKATLSPGLELARAWPLIVDVSRARALLERLRGGGGADARDVSAAPEFKYGHAVPQLLTVVLVACLYAAIAPLVLLPATAAFWAGEVVLARNFLLVYVRRYESGGAAVFHHLAFFVAVSLVAAQLTLVSFVGILGGLREVPCLVPLPVATLVHYRRLVRRYVEPSRFLHRAAAADHGLFDDHGAKLDATYYAQPALVAEAGEGEGEAPAARASFGVDSGAPALV